jgi:beta-glucosidase
MASQGGGTSEVVPLYTVSALEAIKKALGRGVRIEHAVGAAIRLGLSPLSPELAHCVACGEPGVHVRYVTADGQEIRSEHRRDGRLIWFGHQLPRGARVEVTTRLSVDAPGTWGIGVAGVGECRLVLGGTVVIEENVQPPRQSFASSFLDPPQRWVDRQLGTGDQLDLMLTHGPDHDFDFVKLVLGARAPQVEPEEELARAVALAKAAEVAVVVVGTNEETETEGRDRRSTSLPGRQDELVRRVAEANSRTVVVVISGAPVAIPWRDQVSAVLLAPFGGQEFGPALADVLLGVEEPGGRLATTWGAIDAEIPVLSTQPVDGVLAYDEGLNIGYRAWFSTGRQPAYWFGHGLGYTSWRYERIDVPAIISAGQGADVGVRVVNTGTRPGKEVVQVYLSRPGSGIRRPPVWLAGFAVVTASPGQIRDVSVSVAARAFQHWSVEESGWRTESGAFRVSVGRSAGDRTLAADIAVDAD